MKLETETDEPEPVDIAELAHAAYINLVTNVGDKVPGVVNNALWAIGRQQLADVCKALGRDVGFVGGFRTPISE